MRCTVSNLPASNVRVGITASHLYCTRAACHGGTCVKRLYRLAFVTVHHGGTMLTCTQQRSQRWRSALPPVMVAGLKTAEQRK